MVSEFSHDGDFACVDLKVGKSSEAMRILNNTNGLYAVTVLVITEPLQ
jgi:hypothetical protein